MGECDDAGRGEDGAAEFQGECSSKLNPDLYTARPTTSLDLAATSRTCIACASSLPVTADTLRPEHELHRPVSRSMCGPRFPVFVRNWEHMCKSRDSLSGETTLRQYS